VLRAAADLEGVDHLERGRVDHRHAVAAQIGHVDALQIALHGRAEMAGGGFAVEVGRVHHPGHAGHGGGGGGAGAAAGAAAWAYRAAAAAVAPISAPAQRRRRRVETVEEIKRVSWEEIEQPVNEKASATARAAPPPKCR
jgi:hypothetical protein